LIQVLSIKTSSNGIPQLIINQSNTSVTPNSIDFSIVVDQLVEYEINFARKANAILEVFEVDDKNEEAIKSWPSIEIKALKSGILIFKEKQGSLEYVLSLVRMKNAKIQYWLKYIGEEVL